MCLTKIATRKPQVTNAATKKKEYWNKWRQNRSYQLFELAEAVLIGANLGQLSKSAYKNPL